jgi:hypothetical protein
MIEIPDRDGMDEAMPHGMPLGPIIISHRFAASPSRSERPPSIDGSPD